MSAPATAWVPPMLATLTGLHGPDGVLSGNQIARATQWCNVDLRESLINHLAESGRIEKKEMIVAKNGGGKRRISVRVIA